MLLGFSLILGGCSAAPSASSTETTVSQTEATLIQLGDDQVLVNGQLLAKPARCSFRTISSIMKPVRVLNTAKAVRKTNTARKKRRRIP